MPFNLANPVHLLVLLAVVLLIFGPKKLPQLGRSIGDSIREFKKATSSVKEAVEVPEKTES